MPRSPCSPGPIGTFLLPILLAVACGSCFPERQATFVDRNHIDTTAVVKAATKVFVSDASVLLCPLGYKCNGTVIEAEAQRLCVTDALTEVPSQRFPLRTYHIPIDSVLALTYYDEVTTPGRAFASFILGLTGPPLTVVSLYCLSNPKACFGSCPTVYTHDGQGWNYETELFSYSVSRLLETSDMKRIQQPPPAQGAFRLRIANEALETHNINLLRLVAVNHPKGTQVFPGPNGEAIGVRGMHEPVTALNSEGRDILPLLRYCDDRPYRSDSNMVRLVKNGKTSDWIELHFRPPEHRTSVTMVTRLKNSLLSTVLFYEIVLGSQGARAVEWTGRMNNDPLYAAQFRSVYSEFSGVKVQVLRGGAWVQAAAIQDVGPVGYKFVAARIPLEADTDVALRLSFFPDNYLIDYIGLDWTSEEEVPISVSEIPPVAVEDAKGKLRPDVASWVAKDDDQYLVTEPRDVYVFTYQLPAADGGDRTLFVQSKGYYTEWIRGTWLKTSANGYRFDLFHIGETLTALSEAWLRDRAAMESQFFRNRIPITEGL